MTALDFGDDRAPRPRVHHELAPGPRPLTSNTPIKRAAGTPCVCGHARLAHKWRARACKHIDVPGLLPCLCTEFTTAGGAS